MDISPKHLLGGNVGKTKEGVVGEHGPVEVNRDYKVDPYIAGTALAYHLRQLGQLHGGDYEKYPEIDPRQPFEREQHRKIAALAEAALAGRSLPGTNGDAFKALGEELKAAGHPLARAYRWNHMAENLAKDAWIEKWLHATVKKYSPGERDDLFFDRINRAIRQGKGAELIARLQRDIKSRKSGRAGTPSNFFQERGVVPEEALTDAIHRISDRALDREYLKTIQAEKQRGESHDEEHPLYWRKVLEAKPTGALRFDRKSMEWIRKKIKYLIDVEGLEQPHAIAKAYGMAGRSNKE
jgi:hypothetical protein